MKNDFVAWTNSIWPRSCPRSVVFGCNVRFTPDSGLIPLIPPIPGGIRVAFRPDSPPILSRFWSDSSDSPDSSLGPHRLRHASPDIFRTPPAL